MIIKYHSSEGLMYIFDEPHKHYQMRTIACCFALICCAIIAHSQPGVNQDIRVNQVGYISTLPKVAVLVTDTPVTASFRVVDKVNNKVVFTGKPGDIAQSHNSSLKTQALEFTKLRKPGNYYIEIASVGKSWHFTITESPLYGAAVASAKGFYFQRTNELLPAKHADKWSRSAGHADTVVLIHPSAVSSSRPEKSQISSPGGWYDAGDYNKYIVNSGISTGTLLMAVEMYSSFVKGMELNIPQSGNGVPDLLDEAIYNLRWMLTMQDPVDGGVYHKLTNAAFDGMVMPGVTTDPRYVVQKGTGAALNLAAVSALASRVIKPYEHQYPGLADSCWKAAERAYSWALANPELIYDQRAINVKFDPDISTGEYGDRNFTDEWIWASSELHVTSRNEKYLEDLQRRLKDSVSLPSWNQVAALGYYSMINNRRKLSANAKAIASRMQQQLQTIADRYVESISTNAFKTVMGQSRRDFLWGSSAVAANQGMLLMHIFRATGKQSYLETALTNADYLLGRNATGYSFLTGVGSKLPMHPHHRPSEADGIEEPVPGLLVGGPNPGMQDKCNYTFKEPERAYTDEACSYASNEIAINWNAPAVFLFTAISAEAGTKQKREMGNGK